MKFIILLVAVLAITASALKTHKTHHRKLAMTDMGELMSMVQTAIKEKGPIRDVYNMLQGYLAEINADQARHDETRAETLERCEDENNFRQAEIATATQSEEAADAHLNKCESSLSSAQATLEQVNSNINSATVELARVTAIRNAENDLYNQRLQDHADAIKVLEGAVELFQQIPSPSSFLQIQKLSLKMLKSAVKTRRTDVFAPVMAVLAQITQLPSNNVYGVSPEWQAKASQVGDLLQQLQSRIEDSRADYTAQEEESQAAFDAYAATLNTQIQNGNDEKDILNDHIADMEFCINTESAVSNEAGEKLSRNTELRDTAAALCDSYEAEYQHATELRNSQIVVVNQVNAIIVEKFKELADDVVARGVQDENEWEVYVNPYTVDTVAAYEFRNQAEDNSAGAELSGFQNDESLRHF